MRRVALVTSVVLCILLAWSASGLAETVGVVRGRVTNGTPGGGSTQGLEVVLVLFDGQTETDRLVTTADEEGRFRFEGVEAGEDIAYLVRVTYLDVVYSRGMLRFESGMDEVVAEIVVYETTTSDDSIVVQRAHMFVSLTEEGVSVSELHIFFNPGDRTYVGTEEDVEGRRSVTRFVLPKRAGNLSFEDGSLGGRFLETSTGFVDSEPLWPGSTSVIFGYDLECVRGECEMTREFVHPITDLNVLIPDAGARVDSDRYAFQGNVDANGQSHLNFAARNVAAGERVDLRIRLPQSTQASGTATSRPPVAVPWLILGAVLVFLVLVYPFWRRRVIESARKGDQ